MKETELSSLSKTWLFDLDGTIVKHNGYKIDGYDTLLPGAKEFINNIDKDDEIIILSARSSKYKDMTTKFLKENNINYTNIIFDLPIGERILINDMKPGGLKTAHAFNTTRNEFFNEKIVINPEL